MKCKKALISSTITILIAGNITTGGMFVKEYRHALYVENQCKDLQLQIDSLNEKTIIKDLAIKDMQGYIDMNKEKFDKVQQVEHENAEIKKQNEILTKYHSSKGSVPNRGGVPSGRIRLKKIKVEVSAYTSQDAGCDEWTAIGTRCHYGVIAAPKEIPMGTEIMIPGINPDMVFIKEDNGGYIKKVGDVYRIDIWVSDKKTAAAIGRRWLDAYIIEKGE